MSGAPLRFDGKVVLVTGAGNGLGKAYALGFAARGASVVVNDLGVSTAGTGSGTKAADEVVNEIRSKGGKAVANYDSVEDGQKLVQTALDAFGRIDVVVTNAGVLRDKSFARISDDDWDLIQRVHLKGTFMVCRAAWPHMRKQNYGRIITVTSASGIYGNFGQANYSAAKLGIVGLTNTLAIEGKKSNILSNCIAPMAGSRMTKTVMPEDIVLALKPEYVSPLVEYLGHESCEENGGLFEVGAGWIGKVRWHKNDGALLREINSPITAEKVRDNWDVITDFTENRPAFSNTETSQHVVSLVQEQDEKEKQMKQIDPKDPVAQAKAYTGRSSRFTYNERDTMLYALATGVSTAHKDFLRLVYELSDEFQVLPSFGVIPAFACMGKNSISDTPGFKVDPSKILHGEQYLELYKPMPRAATLTSKFSVADVVDKKSGALFLHNVETFDESGEKVAFNQFATFVVGAGNFGGPTSSAAAKPLADPPSRPADAVMKDKTSIDQAALYRLTGDRNPLHIDPNFSILGGFKIPILHGLCSFGYAVRHVMTTFADNDMSLFKAVKVRFVKPVLPGETLQTEMWKEGNRIYFRTKVFETGTVVISGAYVDLHPRTSSSDSADTVPVANLKSTEVFKLMASQASQIKGKVPAVYQWNITQNGKNAATWVIDARAGEVYEGQPRNGKADCTLTLSDDSFVDLVSGKLNTQKAFMSGAVKVSGIIQLAQKFGELFPSAKAKM